MKYNIKERYCKVCNNIYIPNSGPQKYCNDCLKNNKNKIPYVLRGKDKRRIRRINIQNFWGRDGKINWKESEKIAIKILNIEGFKNIESMVDIYPHSFFDIKAVNSDNKVCLFQVTTRIHTNIKKQRKFANILGINNFYILFIKTDLTSYILTKTINTSNHYYIKNINEVKMI